MTRRFWLSVVLIHRQFGINTNHLFWTLTLAPCGLSRTRAGGNADFSSESAQSASICVQNKAFALLPIKSNVFGSILMQCSRIIFSESSENPLSRPRRSAYVWAGCFSEESAGSNRDWGNDRSLLIRNAWTEPIDFGVSGKAFISCGDCRESRNKRNSDYYSLHSRFK